MQACGHVVDWARRPFSTFCQFSSDPSVPLGRLVFYGSDGPHLPFPTVFNNRWWWTDIIGPLRLGGQVERPRGYNGYWKVKGIDRGHFCGTPEMFLEGYDPQLNPPTPRGPGIIPPCCPSVFGGRVAAAAWPSSVVKSWRGPTYPTSGGYALGGRVNPYVGPLYGTSGGYALGGRVPVSVSTNRAPSGGYAVGGAVPVSVGPGPGLAPTGGLAQGGSVPVSVSTTRPSSGGYALGGSVPVSVSTTRPSSGGYALGGSVSAKPVPVSRPTGGLALGGSLTPVVAPGTVTPGSSCATAGTIATGTTYGASISGVGVQQWWRLPGVIGTTTYWLTFTVTSGTLPAPSGSAGSSCGSASPFGFILSHPGCFSGVPGSSGSLWLQFNAPPVGSASYTFSISTTPC